MKLSFSKFILFAVPFIMMGTAVNAADEACGLDICIAVDMSGSICTPGDDPDGHNCYLCHQDCNEPGYSLDLCCKSFADQTIFAKRVAELVSASLPTSRYSLVSFGNEASSHTTGLIGKDAFIAKVDTLDFVGGWTNTGDGIQLCSSLLDNDSHNEKVMLLITDGLPSKGFPGLEGEHHPLHMAWAAYKADLAKHRGVHVVPIMVNTNVSNQNALAKLASDPSEAFTVNSFDELAQDLTGIIESLDYPCGIDEPEENFEPENCVYQPIDVCVAVDMSGSVCSPKGRPSKSCMHCGKYCQDLAFDRDTCCANFDFSKRFAADVAADVSKAVDTARYSLVSFGGKTFTHTSGLVGRDKFIDQVGKLDYLGGWTDTGTALDACWNTLKDSPNEKVMVLITDGTPTKGAPGEKGGYKSVHRDFATDKANLLKVNGVTILPVLIHTSLGDTEFLTTLASTDSQVTLVNEFYELKDDLKKITAKVKCL